MFKYGNYNELLRIIPINLKELLQIVNENNNDIINLNNELFDLLQKYNVKLNKKTHGRIIDGKIVISGKDIAKIIFNSYGFTDAVKQKYLINALITYHDSESFELCVDKARKKYKRNILMNKQKKYGELYDEHWNIQRLKELCNIKDYYVLNIPETDKLYLYIASIVLEVTKKALDIKKFDIYRKGINFLLDFLKYNKELIESNLSFTIGKTEYSTKNIVDYLKGFNKRTIIVNHDYSFFPLDPVESKKELRNVLLNVEKTTPQNLKDLIARKISLYTTIPFVRIHLGKDTFDGYMGFELESGYVILDKLYKNRKKKTIAYNNAIYVVRKEDFEKITKMSKTKVMEAINLGEIVAERIIHKESFEDKVLSYTK